MIVAERKPLEEIKTMVSGFKNVLTVGCGTCVAVCLAGGEKEVGVLNAELKIARKLGGNPIDMGGVTVERQCDMEFLEEIKETVGQFDAMISLACGAGVQFLAERFPDKPVFPGVNTSFIGANRDVGWYEEKCRACGTCVLGMTGGVCPVTMCAKCLFNGPCGGTNQGSCEIHKDQPCAWHMIYERLSKQNRLESIIEICPPNDWRNTIPRTIVQPGYKGRKEAL
ncbi:MAG: methylenetetrahydrofolate reductase C-terminal domain-containing protein [Proteobacteria bacterium]|nr:methylenetetrahydrofolate reductase C-terminal domain-containing protein [Pseudomonadota bacterium]MBU4471824.1 methylenetetrahydrofolate reductase C-terminal domain-containing protein [Pseudomonadota bacterium]MCG2750604.1 methylenetetrahydrofolate reductase C-terminal domain-containing protein [Desulfobacteraceae bacterium]